jgi:ribosome-binding protein aMBF1 (putative translation factor)
LEGKTEKVKCQICGAEVSSKEIYLWSAMKVCEDCYFKKAYPVRTCDPVAVHAAKTLKAAGVKLLVKNLSLPDFLRVFAEYLQFRSSRK